MGIFELFNIIFNNPTINALVVFYKILVTIGVPYALGFSIIALTVFIRLVLYPFTAQQIKASAKMQKVAPHITALKEKHKGDNKKIQEETMRLYREHGVNPAAGCLPLVIQLPIIWGLYHVLEIAVKVSSVKELTAINNVLYFDFLKIQRIWDTTFFGFALGASPSKLMAHAPLIILVPIITGALQFVLSKMMMPEESIITPVTKNEEKKGDDFQAAFQKQSMILFPAMIGFFSFTLPLGLSLYWNAYTIFGILQQYLLMGPGAARPYFKKLNINGKNR
jgi:YidC/Oxa1 family membrane protein insertase